MPFDARAASSELAVTILPVSGLPTGVCYDRLGFKRNSAQDNFLQPNASRARERVVVVVHGVQHDALAAFARADSTMVSCAFGEVASHRHGTIACVWYVGVNKLSSLNDSGGGERWGHYGLSKAMASGRVRWRCDGKLITAATHRGAALVHGSANPHAVLALLGFCEYAKAVAGEGLQSLTIEQHPSLPCAQLFHEKYCHATHPSICLIYQSLGFIKTAMGTYAWYSDVCQPFDACHDRYLALLQIGDDASL